MKRLHIFLLAGPFLFLSLTAHYDSYEREKSHYNIEYDPQKNSIINNIVRSNSTTYHKLKRLFTLEKEKGANRYLSSLSIQEKDNLFCPRISNGNLPILSQTAKILATKKTSTVLPFFSFLIGIAPKKALSVDILFFLKNKIQGTKKPGVRETLSKAIKMFSARRNLEQVTTLSDSLYNVSPVFLANDMIKEVMLYRLPAREASENLPHIYPALERFYLPRAEGKPLAIADRDALLGVYEDTKDEEKRLLTITYDSAGNRITKKMLP